MIRLNIERRSGVLVRFKRDSTGINAMVALFIDRDEGTSVGNVRQGVYIAQAQERCERAWSCDGRRQGRDAASLIKSSPPWM